MRIFSILACGALCLASAACNPGSERPLLLHYDAPATFFEQALPLGNGKLGAMVYGGPVEDRISLNDITLWTGEPDSGALHPDYQVVETLTPWGEAAGWVDKVREALDREDYRQADELHKILFHLSQIIKGKDTETEYHDHDGIQMLQNLRQFRQAFAPHIFFQSE